MPDSCCPGSSGSTPSVRPSHAKNGRTTHSCPETDLSAKLGSSALTLPGAVLGEVFYLTKVDRCGWSYPAKTGTCGCWLRHYRCLRVSLLSAMALYLSRGLSAFAIVTVQQFASLSLSPTDIRGHYGCATGFAASSPFLKAVYSNLAHQTVTLSVSTPSIAFGLPAPAAASVHAATSFSAPGSGGRIVQIVAVNGKPVRETAAIDTGNPSFLSYAPGSSLNAAKTFPFNVTFEGGGTVAFQSAPKINGVASAVMEYSHNVLALGFLQPFDVTFDDQQKVAYFA